MASQGPNSAGAGANVTFSGGDTWNSTGNIVSSNNTYANTFGQGDTNWLAGTNFGFTIPGATIDGVIVEIEAEESAANCTIVEVFLTKDGTTEVGSNQSGGIIDLTTTEIYYEFGSSSNLWGTTLTPADVNSSSFGVMMRGAASTGSNKTIRVDHIRITVFYTALPPIPTKMHQYRQRRA